ncbi:MAG: TlpA family protein disulfide reductase [Acidobacteriota bacterium]|nr:TlpA family protein disulfide reductase [Acidobacteriota bacterium]
MVWPFVFYVTWENHLKCHFMYLRGLNKTRGNTSRKVNSLASCDMGSSQLRHSKSGVSLIVRQGRIQYLHYVYTYIAILAFLQTAALQAEVPLRAECSASGKILTHLDVRAAAHVRFSVAGSEHSCYSITVVIDGNPINGYVEGNELAAVADFERQRALATRPSVGPARPASEPETLASAEEARHYPPFKDFSALDMKGNPVSIHSLKGKINLVCFWSPSNADSSRELLLMNRLYGQFRKQGIDVLAVSLSGDRARLLDALDDFHLGFRNVPNGYDIALRYNVSYSALPVTYVLNENFEVIASGLHTKALEELVKQLIAAK